MKTFITLLTFFYAVAPQLFADDHSESLPVESDYYPITTISLPEGEVIEVSGIEILPGNKVAVASRRGDIFVGEGVWEDEPSPTWTLYARGLHETLGLSWRDGWLYATQRPEVTRMKDRDGDGRADVFETVADDWGINGNYHEYAFGTRHDKNGDIWVILCLTGSGGMRLAMIWHGDFIDGARHWIARGQGFQPPAGNDVIRLPEGLAIAELKTRDSIWPESEYRTKELEFDGYVLDKLQRPTFKYSRDEISISDKPVPVSSSFDEKPGVINRTLKFVGKGNSQNLYFRLAQGNFDKDKDTFSNSELSLSVEGGEVFAEKGELRVPIEFNEGKSELKITYSWAE